MVDHRAISIEYLPNEFLLHIFSFHQLLSGQSYPDRPLSVAWRWHTLAHVCQQWRDLIFWSLCHLEVRLTIPRKSPKTPLYSWPALPLSVWYSAFDYQYSLRMLKDQRADVVAAFEYSDRICEICLPTEMGDYSFWASVSGKSFLELEHLELYGPPFIDLPDDFLCGPTPLPRLRTIVLRCIHLPGLPQLLSSSRGLVCLRLDSHTLTGNRSISPEVLATALSSATKLEHLRITCVEPDPDLRGLNSSLDDLVVLPALTYFHFGDSIEYLENLVSWIHAPHLMNLIVDVCEGVLDVPQLSQFISRTEQLTSLPFRTSISLDDKVFKIEHHFTHPPSPQELSCVYSWKGHGVGWQVSQVGHICAQLSPLASSVKQLKLSVSHLPMIQHEPYTTSWLQLLALFNSVEQIEVFGQGALCTGFACALEQSILEMTQQVLPALRVLRIRDFDFWSIFSMMLFAAVRQHTGRPVTVHHLHQGKPPEIIWCGRTGFISNFISILSLALAAALGRAGVFSLMWIGTD